MNEGGTITLCQGDLIEDYGKLVDEFLKSPIKTVGQLRYRIENLPDDLPLDIGKWDLRLMYADSSRLKCYLTRKKRSELI